MTETAHGGHDDRQVFGSAAGHDGVDGDLVGDDDGVAAGDLAEDFVAAQARALQHIGDRHLGRRHHRQAVGPAGVVVRLDERGGVGRNARAGRRVVGAGHRGGEA